VTGRAPAPRRPWPRRTAIIFAGVLASYASLNVRPQVVFAYEVHSGNVVLHARTPLPPEALAIAESARRRVSRSPLYVTEDRYDVFLCDSSDLFAFFSPTQPKVGGVANEVTRHVFMRPGTIERDRLVGYSGHEVPGSRTLTYFVAHEIAHVMVSRRLGRLAHLRLAEWQREGYPDYLAKAGAFDFDAVRKAFQAGEKELDPLRSGLYLRHHLLVAHALDHKGMTPEALLAQPLDPSTLERELLGP
jgi:hypothetical protein